MKNKQTQNLPDDVETYIIWNAYTLALKKLATMSAKTTDDWHEELMNEVKAGLTQQFFEQTAKINRETSIIQLPKKSLSNQKGFGK